MIDGLMNNVLGSKRPGYAVGNRVLEQYVKGENVADILPKKNGYVYSQSEIAKISPKYRLTLKDMIEKTGTEKMKVSVLKGMISYLTEKAETREDMGKVRALVVYGLNKKYDVLTEAHIASLKNIDILEKHYNKIQEDMKK